MAASNGIPAQLIVLVVFVSTSRAIDDEFHEELLIKHLPNGQLYLNFQFSTIWNSTSSGELHENDHYHLFPKSLGEILAKYSVQELHLSLTQGTWRYGNWGYPIQSAPPGAELLVWFLPSATSKIWTELNNALSGQICASLNFMDAKSTVIPKWSFRPRGATHKNYKRLFRHVRYAALPREVVCTENLTPWKKLLPCSSKVGLATLFNAVKLYDSKYHSLSINVRSVCHNTNCSQTSLELVQSLAVVFDLPAKNFGRADWSFKKLFGRMLASTCPLAKTSYIYVDATNNQSSAPYHLTVEPTLRRTFTRGGYTRQVAVYDIHDVIGRERLVNLGANFDHAVKFVDVKPLPLYAHRFTTGYGQETGGISTQIYNNNDQELSIIYMESAPWYIQVFLHTMKIESNGQIINATRIHYEPGQTRKKPYLLEVVFTLPPRSVTKFSIEFERALLKWTEYPPDANHGFYINSAVISCILPDGRFYEAASIHNSIMANSFEDNSTFFVRLHTESLLVSLPTPDFSMPYNVICLVCTVVAIAFGSVHNMTTRRFTIADENDNLGFFAKLKKKLMGKPNEQEMTESKEKQS
ncbi:GPI-anchor transamidase component PIGT-like isoform X2 [Tubulanus polymorphus]|uniref:GPI-anchor transamidase component PIGT-like isoform X2 n=1 Tax=Tubulanus polymorphus TaxID=672921 RepID=UPI003DA4B978